NDFKSESRSPGRRGSDTLCTLRRIGRKGISFAEESHVGDFNGRLISVPMLDAPDRKSGEPKINLDIAQLHRVFAEWQGLRVEVKMRALDAATGLVKRGPPHALGSADDARPMRQRGRQRERRHAVHLQVVFESEMFRIRESLVVRRCRQTDIDTEDRQTRAAPHCPRPMETRALNGWEENYGGEDDARHSRERNRES